MLFLSLLLLSVIISIVKSLALSFVNHGTNYSSKIFSWSGGLWRTPLWRWICADGCYLLSW